MRYKIDQRSIEISYPCYYRATLLPPSCGPIPQAEAASWAATPAFSLAGAIFLMTNCVKHLPAQSYALVMWTRLETSLT